MTSTRPRSPASPQRLKYSVVSSSIIATCLRNRLLLSPVLNIFFCSRKICKRNPQQLPSKPSLSLYSHLQPVDSGSKQGRQGRRESVLCHEWIYRWIRPMTLATETSAINRIHFPVTVIVPYASGMNISGTENKHGRKDIR